MKFSETKSPSRSVQIVERAQFYLRPRRVCKAVAISKVENEQEQYETIWKRYYLVVEPRFFKQFLYFFQSEKMDFDNAKKDQIDLK